MHICFNICKTPLLNRNNKYARMYNKHAENYTRYAQNSAFSNGTHTSSSLTLIKILGLFLINSHETYLLYFVLFISLSRSNTLESCKSENIFEETIEWMVLYQSNFWAFWACLQLQISFGLGSGCVFVFSGLGPR